jgi:hypothetical protein
MFICTRAMISYAQRGAERRTCSPALQIRRKGSPTNAALCDIATTRLMNGEGSIDTGVVSMEVGSST